MSEKKHRFGPRTEWQIAYWGFVLPVDAAAYFLVGGGLILAVIIALGGILFADRWTSMR